jgi:cold shock CspA family protein
VQNISSDYVATIEGKNERMEGQIDNILSHGGSGFIKPSQGGSNVYFNMKDVFGKKTLVKGEKVDYELLKGKDEKIRAIKITIRG